jgi:hypothetical protein
LMLLLMLLLLSKVADALVDFESCSLEYCVVLVL